MKNIKNIAFVVIALLFVMPALSYADVSDPLATVTTGGDSSNTATVDNSSALNSFTTGGDTSNTATAEGGNSLSSFTTGGDTSNTATADNSNSLASFTTGGDTSNSGTSVPTPVSGGTSGSGSTGSGSGSTGLSSSGRATTFTMSPLYVVRLEDGSYWVAYTTNPAAEGSLVYNGETTGYGTTSTAHSFTLKLDADTTYRLQAFARIGKMIYYGKEVVINPNTVASVIGDNVDNTSASTSASTTEVASSTDDSNTASVSNAVTSSIISFFKRMWRSLTASMCVLPN